MTDHRDTFLSNTKSLRKIRLIVESRFPNNLKINISQQPSNIFCNLKLFASSWLSNEQLHHSFSSHQVETNSEDKAVLLNAFQIFLFGQNITSRYWHSKCEYPTGII